MTDLPLPNAYRMNAFYYYSAVFLAMADCIAFVLSLIVLYVFRFVVWGYVPTLWVIWPATVIWLVLRSLLLLYPPLAMPQPEELRRSVYSTIAAAAVHLSMLVALGDVGLIRLTGVLVWVLVVPLGYFLRSLCKGYLIARGRYGAPYVVVGDAGAIMHTIREMLSDPELGMVPVAAYGPHNLNNFHGVPLHGSLQDAVGSALPLARRAILALTRTDDDQEQRERMIDELAAVYPHLWVIGETVPGNMWTKPRPIGAILALEVHQARFSQQQRRAKRAFDLLVSVPLLVLVAPSIGIAACAIKIISPGPAFFSQTREGIRGNPVQIYKLRTMVPNAEQQLAGYLAANPDARFEWERTMKLRHDPRIIPRIGSFLRRASIDELPQLYNVVRGDMSLVGPRIMPRHEVDRYDIKGQQLRRDVPPGLTGLWQVTSRNNSDLKVREVANCFMYGIGPYGWMVGSCCAL